MESRLGIRPSVLTWIEVFRKRHRANFPLAQVAAAPFLITFFDNWWYEDNGTDESENFLWTRLQFKVNRLGTASVSSLEPLRDKWVTFAHEMKCQAPNGLSFVMVSNTWTRLSLEEMVVGSTTLVLAFTPCASTCVCRCWSWARFKGANDEFFATPDGKKSWEPYDYITGFMVNQLHLEVGIARNDAITENTFALFVGMCIRTATFIVGKPGASKSLFLSLDLLTGQTAAAEAAVAFF